MDVVKKSKKLMMMVMDADQDCWLEVLGLMKELEVKVV